MKRLDLEVIVFAVDKLIDAEAGDCYGDRHGACDQVNGIFAQVARNLGYPAVLVRVYVREERKRKRPLG